MLITPEYVFQDVTHITPAFLARKGITALVLDIDNTLTADGSQELPAEGGGLAAGHARRRRPADHRVQRHPPAGGPLCPEAGAGLRLLGRQTPDPRPDGGPAPPGGWKSAGWPWWGTSSTPTGWPRPLYGIPALMVVPRGPDRGAQVRLKRKWERRFWQRYYDRGGKLL